jgi:hypothetical protein
MRLTGQHPTYPCQHQQGTPYASARYDPTLTSRSQHHPANPHDSALQSLSRQEQTRVCQVWLHQWPRPHIYRRNHGRRSVEAIARAWWETKARYLVLVRPTQELELLMEVVQQRQLGKDLNDVETAEGVDVVVVVAKKAERVQGS